jgi:hypothetical protein
LERDFDVVISCNNSDSDNLSSNDDWTHIGVSDPLPPSNHHHCRNIGHHRCRSPDYQRTKRNNNYLREQRKEMINKKREHWQSYNPLPHHDIPFIPRSGKIHNKVEELSKKNILNFKTRTNEKKGNKN